MLNNISIKKVVAIITAILLLFMMVSCVKKDTKIVTCLDANDLVGAISTAKKTDEKSVALAEEEIKKAAKIIVETVRKIRGEKWKEDKNLQKT